VLVQHAPRHSFCHDKRRWKARAAPSQQTRRVDDVQTGRRRAEADLSGGYATRRPRPNHRDRSQYRGTVSVDLQHPRAHPDFIAEWRDDPIAIAQDHETIRLINDALGTLDEKHHTVFVLRDIEGLSTEETSELLGLSISNVNVRLLRARLALRERLTAVLGDPDRRVQPAHHHGD
jgi:RNA polymerase sigma factor (sigma-70 family)